MSCGRASRYAASSVATMLLVAACAFHPHTDAAAQPDSRPPAGWPESLNDLTVVWSAEHGIDLTAGPAVAVRAYTESYLLASLTGDDKYLYPGFEHAVNPNKTVNDPMGTQQLWPDTGRPPNLWIGTEQQHILSITFSGRDVIVVTCEYVFGTAEPGRHGDYADHYVMPEPDGGIDPMRITMTAPTDPGPPKPPQQGPARAPSADVFNGWKITNHQGGWFVTSGVGSDWPTWHDDHDKCLAKAPPHPNLVRGGGAYPRSQFPTLPAVPGWPIHT